MIRRLGFEFQYTHANSVNDLVGLTSYAGASTPTPVSVGAEAVSFSPINELESGSIDGFQVNIGVGLGVDAHLTESYTENMTPQELLIMIAFVIWMVN